MDILFSLYLRKSRSLSLSVLSVCANIDLNLHTSRFMHTPSSKGMGNIDPRMTAGMRHGRVDLIDRRTCVDRKTNGPRYSCIGSERG